ncbi:MAG: DNA repair protein RadA, partial [Oscillospiraceae bacterium]|nr:DNA repair protein RadA [Oscillospiraceae bacterium]
MSPKAKTEFVCAACGQAAPAWSGRCPACGEWNTMEEALRAPAKPAAAAHGMRPQSLEAFDADCERRVATGIGEFDRVLGGGIVPGELTLLSGDPGIGKSTLLLQ